MKRVTFDDNLYIIFIGNKDDIENKSLLWWNKLDYYTFRELRAMRVFWDNLYYFQNDK